MEREHASEEPFNSHNVFGTTPRAEWLYVVTMEVGSRKETNLVRSCPTH